MRAGLASLRKFERLSGWDDPRRARRRSSARSSPRDSDRSRRPLDVVRDGSIFWIHPHTDGAGPPSGSDSAAATRSGLRRFFHAAIARGVYLPPSPYEVGFLSLAHDADTLATAAWALIAAAREADPA